MVRRGAIRGILFFALNAPDFFFFSPPPDFFPLSLGACSQASSLTVRSALRTDIVRNVFA